MAGAGPDQWRYESLGGAMLATWPGPRSAALAPHYHRETQLVLMTAGRRRFRVPDGLVLAEPGMALILPPGLPHVALETEGALAHGRNLYLTSDLPGWGWRSPVTLPLPAWLKPSGEPDPARLSAWVDDALRPLAPRHPGQAEALIARVLRDPAPLARIAIAEGWSREGFARRFLRLTGMTPQTCRLSDRLNQARAALALGLPAALAAAEAGFADQSHLGRQFRASFGTTPDAFRRAMMVEISPPAR